jgi:hypothetical protein
MTLDLPGYNGKFTRPADDDFVRCHMPENAVELASNVAHSRFLCVCRCFYAQSMCTNLSNRGSLAAATVCLNHSLHPCFALTEPLRFPPCSTLTSI